MEQSPRCQHYRIAERSPCGVVDEGSPQVLSKVIMKAEEEEFDQIDLSIETSGALISDAAVPIVGLVEQSCARMDIETYGGSSVRLGGSKEQVSCAKQLSLMAEEDFKVPPAVLEEADDCGTCAQWYSDTDVELDLDTLSNANCSVGDRDEEVRAAKRHVQRKRKRKSLSDWWLAGANATSEPAASGRTPRTQDMPLHSPRIPAPLPSVSTEPLRPSVTSPLRSRSPRNSGSPDLPSLSQPVLRPRACDHYACSDTVPGQPADENAEPDSTFHTVKFIVHSVFVAFSLQFCVSSRHKEEKMANARSNPLGGGAALGGS